MVRAADTGRVNVPTFPFPEGSASALRPRRERGYGLLRLCWRKLRRVVTHDPSAGRVLVGLMSGVDVPFWQRVHGIDSREAQGDTCLRLNRPKAELLLE